jgi:nitric oxide reductase subunit B
MIPSRFVRRLLFMLYLSNAAGCAMTTYQKVSFFGFNIGFLLLTLGTLFPVGILQAWTSYKQGLWTARDASFFEQGFVRFVGMVRMIPDLTIICLGVIPLGYFLFKTYRHLKAGKIQEGESVWDRLGIQL